MATDKSTVDLLLDRLHAAGPSYTTRRMFGEYCLYRDGVPVALVCDDELFVKDTPPGRATMARFTDVVLGAPYTGACPHLRLAPDLWDEGDSLHRLLDATALALPPPKPRRPRAGATPAP